MIKTRALFSILVVCLVLMAFMAEAVFGAAKSDQSKRQATIRKIKPKYEVMSYGLPNEWLHSTPDGSQPAERRPIAQVTSSAHDSPGLTVGYTWWDLQHHGSVGRMVETGPHSGEPGPTLVHFSWMYLPEEPPSMAEAESRSYAYNAYNSGTGQLAGFSKITHDTLYSGYVNIDVTPDNRAIVGGHTRMQLSIEEEKKYQCQMHFDVGPAIEIWDTWVRVPDSLAAYGPQVHADESLWPKFSFQFPSDPETEDTVLHIISNVSDLQYGTLMYYRKVGWEGAPESQWTYPPYIIDSTFGVAHDITAEREGTKVALAWFAGLCYDEENYPDCDTCSVWSIYGPGLGSYDSDLYIQKSTDQGVTWEPRQNMTKFEPGAPGYKAAIDASILFDQGGELHVAYAACRWPADDCIEEGGGCFSEDFYGIESRLAHWSEGYPVQRFIADATYPMTNDDGIAIDSCGPGGWDMRVAKVALSECDGKLYALWVQYQDNVTGEHFDCADYYTGDYYGPANGELYVSVSGDDGLSWDAGRNLTNSRTNLCEGTVEDPCMSDAWPSMNRWGRQVQGGETWDPDNIVNPAGGGATDWYLDIQYVNDMCAGAIVYGEGEWTFSPIRWFRMPCVEPIENPFVLSSINDIGDPHYLVPGDSIDSTFFFENIGNMPGTFSIAVIKDDEPTKDWLAVGDFGTSGYSGTLGSGLVNMDTGFVMLDAGELSYGNYYGRLAVTGNDTIHMPFNIEIELIVTDTIVFLEYDTVTGAQVRLVVANNGNVGREGYGEWNMDYWNRGDQCDSNSTHTYLYEGTPVIGWLEELDADYDTVMNYSMWGRGWLNVGGFRPYTDYPVVNNSRVTNRICGALNAEYVESGTFTTWDSTIAIERVWYAPRLFPQRTTIPLGEWDDTLSTYTNVTDNVDPNFIIQYMRVWSHDGYPHNGIMIGEVIDWDIPWDEREDDDGVSAVNDGGFDSDRKMLWMTGYENPDDTGYCQDSSQFMDERFGGMAMIESYLDGSSRATAPYSGYVVAHTDTLQASNGFYDGQLYASMASSGYRNEDDEGDSTTDLHAAFCYEKNLDFTGSTVYEVVTVLATVREGTITDLNNLVDGAFDWYQHIGGLDAFRDTDLDGVTDICDTCCAIMGDYDHNRDLVTGDIIGWIAYAFHLPGPPPGCPMEADANGDYEVSIADITHLINYAFKFGPPNAPCYGPFNDTAE